MLGTSSKRETNSQDLPNGWLAQISQSMVTHSTITRHGRAKRSAQCL